MHQQGKRQATGQYRVVLRRFSGRPPIIIPAANRVEAMTEAKKHMTRDSRSTLEVSVKDRSGHTLARWRPYIKWQPVAMSQDRHVSGWGHE